MQVDDKFKGTGRTTIKLLECALAIAKKESVPVFVFASTTDIAKNICNRLIDLTSFLGIPLDVSNLKGYGKECGLRAMPIEIDAIVLYDHTFYTG